MALTKAPCQELIAGIDLRKINRAMLSVIGRDVPERIRIFETEFLKESGKGDKCFFFMGY